MFAWARACVAAICCASLALTGLAGAQTEYDVPRGGDWKKYEGNPRWSADAVYSRDDDLGTPPSQPPQFSPWWDVAGEKVRVVSRWTRSGRFQGRSDYNLTFFGLENDKGKVLLPVVFKDVVVAPGVGLFVRSYLGEQRYERLDLKTGRRTPVEGLIDVDVIQAGPTMGTSIFSYAVGEVNVKPLREPQRRLRARDATKRKQGPRRTGRDLRPRRPAEEGVRPALALLLRQGAAALRVDPRAQPAVIHPRLLERASDQRAGAWRRTGDATPQRLI
jgi:hypothetical protein